jgi:carbamoyl-phosphate synthase large subunit
MTRPTILVTGAGSFCAVNIIKSLKATGKYRVIAADIVPASVGVFRSDAGFMVAREGKDGKFIENLLTICKQESVSLIIPGFDTENTYLLNAQKRFEKIGVKVLIGNKRLVEIGTDKHQLAGFFKSQDIPYLNSFHVSEKEIALEDLSFPIVIKPREGWGQRGFHLVKTREDFDRVIKMVQPEQHDYMIQEYIDDSEGEFTNSVSVALDGDILGCICTKRDLVKGESRKIIVDIYPEVREQMIKIAKAIGSPGPINLQCRLKNGIAYVFEINARFSTTNSVRAACDYNEVELLVDHYLTGEKTYIKDYKKQVALAYLDYVFINPEDIDDFGKNFHTREKGIIHNWL